jgi:hypothetical protein
MNRKVLKGGGACLWICLFDSRCHCAHAAIGRRFSTFKKGRKQRRLRLTSLDKINKTQKGRHNPGLESYMETETLLTHTHIRQAMWVTG